VKQFLCPAVIGRETELGELRAAIELSATAGRGTTLFLVGEAGVGKTRLAREAISEARRMRSSVLHGRAVDAHDVVAFRPFSEALFSYFRDEAPPEDPQLEPFRPMLARLVPEWRQAGVAPPDDSIVVLAEAILRLLRVVGRERGCLLFLDDLHWADAETLAIVEYLARNIANEPIVLVGGLRPDEGPAATGLVHQLVAQRAATEVAVAGLTTADVAAMARACLSVDELPVALGRLVADHADGLPFLVEELLAGAVDSGALVEHEGEWLARGPVQPDIPLTLMDSVGARLARLGEHSGVLVAASVLGRQFDWRLLPTMTGLDELAVLQTLRAGVDAQLLVADPTDRSGFRFRHALTQGAVLQRLLPAEREVLARRALEAMGADRPDLSGDRCVLAAGLAEAAGERRLAADLLVRAGRQAVALGALASAEDAFERARRLADEPSVAAEAMDGLCETFSLAGKSELAQSAGTELLATLDRLRAPPERVAAVHLRLARAALVASDPDVADRHVAQARSVTDDGALSARADAIEARIASHAGDHERARGLAERALAVAEQLDVPDVRCEALEQLGRIARTHDAEHAERMFEAALRVAEEHDLAVWRIRALFELATIDLYLVRADDRMVATRDLATSSGALATAAQVDLHLAHWCVDQFQLERSVQAAQRASEVARRFHLDDLLAVSLISEVTAVGRLGDAEQMETLLSEAAELSDDPTIDSIVWGHCRAMASLVQENQRRAGTELDAAMEILRVHPSSVFYPERGLWALLRALRDEDADAACAEVRSSGAAMARIVRGYVRLAEAVILGRRGQAEEAEAAFAEGDADLEPVNWLRHHARRLVAQAAIEDGWGDPVTWLYQGLALFEDHRQERLTSACRSLLRKGGAPVPRRGSDSGIPGALRELGVTAREFEVLTLLADGLSNSEIAHRLYMSPRTVERHVANLTTKSGLRTRSELIAFAARSVTD
jgi:predicted ATPase/DNA-binding CsgD family transcriptional regulator